MKRARHVSRTSFISLSGSYVLQIGELLACDLNTNISVRSRRDLHCKLLCQALTSPIKAIRDATRERLFLVFKRNTLLRRWIMDEVLNHLNGMLPFHEKLERREEFKIFNTRSSHHPW